MSWHQPLLIPVCLMLDYSALTRVLHKLDPNKHWGTHTLRVTGYLWALWNGANIEEMRRYVSHCNPC